MGITKRSSDTEITEADTATRPVIALMGELADRARGEVDGTEITASTVDRIMQAETIDDVFEAAGISKLTSSQDLEDVPLLVQSIEVRASDAKYAKGTLGSFLVVHCVNLETGEPVAMGTGAPKIVASLVKLEKLGALPISVVIRGKETEGGTLLYLEKYAGRL